MLGGGGASYYKKNRMDSLWAFPPPKKKHHLRTQTNAFFNFSVSKDTGRDLGLSQRRGGPPKWMVENHMEHPMNKWMIWGVKHHPYFWGSTPIGRQILQNEVLNFLLN